MLFSEDRAHLERTIHKDQRSTSLDAEAFTSTDTCTQTSTDTRPSPSTDIPRSTSTDTTPRSSIDPQSQNMVAVVILKQDENGNLYDQDGHLRNATCQKLDAQGTIIPDADATGAAQPVEKASQPRALANYNRPDEYYTNRSAIHLPEVPSDPEVVVGPGGYKEPGGLPFPGPEEISSAPGDCMGTRKFLIIITVFCHPR